MTVIIFIIIDHSDTEYPSVTIVLATTIHCLHSFRIINTLYSVEENGKMISHSTIVDHSFVESERLLPHLRTFRRHQNQDGRHLFPRWRLSFAVVGMKESFREKSLTAYNAEREIQHPNIGGESAGEKSDEA